jgi:hypothetical protein
MEFRLAPTLVLGYIRMVPHPPVPPKSDWLFQRYRVEEDRLEQENGPVNPRPEIKSVDLGGEGYYGFLDSSGNPWLLAEDDIRFLVTRGTWTYWSNILRNAGRCGWLDQAKNIEGNPDYRPVDPDSPSTIMMLSDRWSDIQSLSIQHSLALKNAEEWKDWNPLP